MVQRDADLPPHGQAKLCHRLGEWHVVERKLPGCRLTCPSTWSTSASSTASWSRKVDVIDISISSNDLVRLALHQLEIHTTTNRLEARSSHGAQRDKEGLSI